MKRREITRLGVAGVLGGLMWPRLARAQDPAWAEVAGAAAQEGEVVMYHNLNPGGMEVVAQEFRAAHPGMQASVMRLGSAALIQRFGTEFAADRNVADVVITAADQSLFDGVQAGWMAEWAPPELAAFPPEANFDGRNMLFNVSTTRDTLVWNTTRVQPSDAPKEWADLFDPRWKGRIGMNPPWRSVPQQAIIAYWEKLGLGNTAAKMKANDVRFFEGSGGVLQALLRGDIQVAQMLDLPLNEALADGAPIGVAFPESGTTASKIWLFVAARARNPNVARVLANWLMTSQGQLLLQTHGGLAATRPGTPPMSHLPATESLSNVHDGLSLTPPEKQKEIVEHWRQTFGIL